MAVPQCSHGDYRWSTSTHRWVTFVASCVTCGCRLKTQNVSRWANFHCGGLEFWLLRPPPSNIANVRLQPYADFMRGVIVKTSWAPATFCDGCSTAARLLLACSLISQRCQKMIAALTPQLYFEEWVNLLPLLHELARGVLHGGAGGGWWVVAGWALRCPVACRMRLTAQRSDTILCCHITESGDGASLTLRSRCK